MTHRILHLSDTHATGSGFNQDGVNAVASLEQILHDARFVPGIDAVVISGDIADDGSAEGCAAVLERVGKFAAERGIPQIYSTGNHDRRPGFTAVFGSGHVGADRSDVGRLSTAAGEERAAVSEVSGLRVITLDSLVPGEDHGVISDVQLEWLGEVLAEPAPAGSIVVLHHPPALLDIDFLATISLRNALELGAVIAGTDVRAVLCGHFHLQVTGSLNGVPVWSTPGVVTRLDATAPRYLVRAVLGAGASIVDLGGPYSPVFHVLEARDPQVGQQVFLFDPVTRTRVDQEQ
jgi:3',5'-cyclic AMP phosphodiesterase CpdA